MGLSLAACGEGESAPRADTSSPREDVSDILEASDPDGSTGAEADTRFDPGDTATSSDETGTDTSPSGTDTPFPEDAGGGETEVRPLLLAFTYHLEGGALVQTREAFDRYVIWLREVSDLFHEYNAIPTWEAAEIVKRSIDFGVNILKELEDRGDCIGLHANGVGFVPSDPDYTLVDMVTELQRQAELIRSLGVGVRHVSNICSAVDWVKAVREAGFEAATAMVDYCLKSLSDPGEAASCQSPAECHDAWPGTIEGQMTPWHAESGANWTTPASDGLLLVPTSGAVTCASEHAAGEVSPTHCDYDPADATAVLAEIEATINARQPGKTHTMVLVASWGKKPDEAVMKKILGEIKTRWVDTGHVRWVKFTDLIDEVEREQ
jgi:hypothetical protein